MAMEQLGTGITPKDFMVAHIRSLGPFVLGTMVWGAVKNEAWEDWNGFRYLLEDQFGFTCLQILDESYTIQLGPNESATAFILRVEDKHRWYGVDPE